MFSYVYYMLSHYIRLVHMICYITLMMESDRPSASSEATLPSFLSIVFSNFECVFFGVSKVLKFISKS